jgi:hypothetical protein
LRGGLLDLHTMEVEVVVAERALEEIAVPGFTRA